MGTDENGIEAVGDRLEALRAMGTVVDAVNIIAEGNEGNFWLGNAFVSHDNLDQYEAQLQRWKIGLGSSADLLIYSCFTALGMAGESLVESLAQSTGADVAASTNLTGSDAFGGDWTLEHQVGTIDYGLGLESDVVENFGGRLVVFTATNATDLINHMTTANASIGVADTINLANNIILTAIDNMTDGSNGLPSIIDGKLTINGMGNTITRDAGAPNFRLFHIGIGGLGNSELEINDTTLSGGVANAGGLLGSRGGAIFNNQGTVTLNNSTVSGNSATDAGGGIANYTNANATVITIADSAISGNSAPNGGGIYNHSLAANGITMTIDRTTISGNSVSNNGGGILNLSAGGNGGVVTISQSTLSDNTAGGGGGGIFNDGRTMANAAGITLVNTTISGNSAVDNGGGVYNYGDTTNAAIITLTNSTIVNNTAARGGGVFNDNDVLAVAGSQLIVGNSIIAANRATDSEPDVGRNDGTTGPITDQGNNLIGIDTLGAFTISTLVGTPGSPLDSLLLPVGDNGGPTQTHALDSASPAFNAGNDALASGLSTDQRGENRFNGTIDIGAFEFQDSSTPATSDGSTTTNTSDTSDTSVIPSDNLFSPQELAFLQLCPPVCDSTEANNGPQTPERETEVGYVAPAANRSSDSTIVVEALDESFTAEFSEFLGLEDTPIATNIAQDHLHKIEAQGGIKAAFVYMKFGRNFGSNSAPGILATAPLDSDPLQLVLVTAQGQEIYVPVPEATRKQVQLMVQRFRRQVANPNRIGTDHYLFSAQQLYQWLIAPLDPLLTEENIDTIGFIVDAGLRSLPLAVLHDGEQFLVEKYNFSMVPSLSLTDFNYAPIDNYSVLVGGTTDFIAQPPLPSAAMEINTIPTLWPGQQLLNGQFTLENLKNERQQQNYDIIHLATHGSFSQVS